MLFRRLRQANKKAKKRFDFYHFDHYVNFTFGAYRKRKGCECRTCSARKQGLKYERNEKERTLTKKIKNEII